MQNIVFTYLDTAAQKKAQTLHDPRRRDLLATD